MYEQRSVHLNAVFTLHVHTFFAAKWNTHTHTIQTRKIDLYHAVLCAPLAPNSSESNARFHVPVSAKYLLLCLHTLCKKFITAIIPLSNYVPEGILITLRLCRTDLSIKSVPKHVCATQIYSSLTDTNRAHDYSHNLKVHHFFRIF